MEFIRGSFMFCCMDIDLTTQKIYLRINPSKIHFLKSILEGYDGMAILSVLDAQHGLILIRFPGEQYTAVLLLLADLSGDLCCKKTQGVF